MDQNIDFYAHALVILVFTPTSKAEIDDAVKMGADGVYLDFVSLLE